MTWPSREIITKRRGFPASRDLKKAWLLRLSEAPTPWNHFAFAWPRGDSSFATRAFAEHRTPAHNGYGSWRRSHEPIRISLSGASYLSPLGAELP